MVLAHVIFFCLGLAPTPDTVVYSNDFNGKLGSTYPEWASSKIAFEGRFLMPGKGTLPPEKVTNVESPKGNVRFLGEFGGPRIDPTARTRVRQSVTLQLKDLTPHKGVKVEFDLLILKSWDGSSPMYGPDRWKLAVEGGPTLVETTFSNNPKLDADRSFQDYPKPGSKQMEGSAVSRTLGYQFFGDSIYKLSATFPHQGETLTLVFSSDLFEGKGIGDESWGLDNVVVRTTTDEPLQNDGSPRD